MRTAARSTTWSRARARFTGASTVLAVALLLAGVPGPARAADPPLDLLLRAVRNGDLAQADRILMQGEPVNGRDTSGTAPLHAAILSNQPEAVQFLIDRGADVNKQAVSGSTPLMEAARRGSVEVVRLLLASGADAKAANPHNGETSLHAAASSGKA